MAVDDYDPVFQAAAQEWNVDPTLLKAVAHVESGGNMAATSGVGAQGMMQIMPQTARDIGITNNRDPAQQIYGAAKYLSQALDAEKSPEGALLYYHGGPGWRQAFGQESQGYVPKVAAAYRLYAPPPSDAGSYQVASSGAPPGPSGNDAVIGAALARLKGASSPTSTPSTGGGDNPIRAMNPDDFVAAITGKRASAPAQAASTPANPIGAMSPDDFVASVTRGTPAPAQAPIVAPHPAPDGSGSMTNLSDADFWKFKGGATPAQGPATVPAQMPLSAVPDTVAFPTPQANTMLAGAGRAVRDVVDAPAQLLARGISPIFGGPSGDQVAAGNAADLAAYQQQYGNNPLAQASRLAGDVLTTALPASVAGQAVTLGGRALLGAGPLAGAVINPLAGAAAGATGAALMTGSSDAPVGQQIKQGAELGGALGAAAPVLGVIGGGVRNALTGAGTSPEVATLAQNALDRGIPVTGGQISTSPAVRFLDSVTKRLPFSGAAATSEAQQTAFNRAVAQTFGENATQITPDVMTQARNRLGQQFDDIASKTTVQADTPFLQDLQQVAEEAKQVLTAQERGVLNNQITNVLDAAQKGGGALSGDVFQALTRRGAPLDRAMQSSDPNIKFYAGQVKDALDNALSRSAPPELQNQLQQARYQYRNMKTVEDLVEKSPTGNISPALLQSRVNAVGRKLGDRVAYGGGGDLADLANIGRQFLTNPASSGTAERAASMGLLFEAPQMALDPLLAAKIAGGLAAGRMTGAYLRSPFYTNMLIRNGLAPPPPVNPQAVLPLLATGGNALLNEGAP